MHELLEISDYPFPTDIDVDKVTCMKIRSVINERNYFNRMIERENLQSINEFISNHSNLKFIYNTDNNTALEVAIERKKFKVFFHLKSFGFQGISCDDAVENLDDPDRKEALEHARSQRKSNVKVALTDEEKPAHYLSIRSLIHNRRIKKEDGRTCREKILKWFQDVQKVAPEMIVVAASCEDLKIIFDFESDSVRLF
jgi:hypothetical protein